MGSLFDLVSSHSSKLVLAIVYKVMHLINHL